MKKSTTLVYFLILIKKIKIKKKMDLFCFRLKLTKKSLNPQLHHRFDTSIISNNFRAVFYRSLRFYPDRMTYSKIKDGRQILTEVT